MSYVRAITQDVGEHANHLRHASGQLLHLRRVGSVRHGVWVVQILPQLRHPGHGMHVVKEHLIAQDESGTRSLSMFAYLATNIPVIDRFSVEPLEEILEKIKIAMYDCIRREL